MSKEATILQLCELAKRAPYSESLRANFKKQALKYLKEIAKNLGLEPRHYDLRYNPGGIAGSGDAILHTDCVYIHINDFGCYWREVDGRRDYTGKQNRRPCNYTAREFAVKIQITLNLEIA